MAALATKLDKQVKGLDSSADSLTKRLHYLEMTAKNSQEHISQMLRLGGGGESAAT